MTCKFSTARHLLTHYLVNNMKNRHVDVVSLGCSKNLVDSERLIKQLEAGGYTVEADSPSPKGGIVIINTCGFIGDAKEESVNTILDFAKARQHGQIKRLFVMGCLSERYFKELNHEIPEVDKYYGKFNWQELLHDLKLDFRQDLRNERTLTTPGHYAYLKISEGCNRSCSYCAIPLITGRHKSETIDNLIDEAKRLAKKEVKELQLIAQDLSMYGIDIYRKPMLASLVDELSQIEGIEWIRLHYAYPAGFPLDILDVMANNPKLCNYLDIALQHISNNMLKLMRRNFSKEQTIELLHTIRQKVPDINLRTTFITGHPGETEEDFNELIEFITQFRFERLGVFCYSHEEDTYAFKNYKDDIPEEVKQQRADTIMELQGGISHSLNQKKIGTTQKVIIDRREFDYMIGRTEYDSPEVDPEVLIKYEDSLQIGQFYNVKIIEADDYDLFASVI